MPIGARKVALCFSPASMRMVKHNIAVRNISMKRPRTTDVLQFSPVRTVSGPGNKPDTVAAAAMPAASCEMISRAAFSQPIAPTKARSIDTCVILLAVNVGLGICGAHSRVEQSSTDAEEDPDIDRQRKTKCQRDV